MSLSIRAFVWAILLLGAPSTVVGAVYLSSYASNGYASPVGYDAPKYVWRSNLVSAEGLDSLSGSVPEPFRVNADRPAYPALASLVSSFLSISTIRFAVVLPAVLAIAIGLAAGALGMAALGAPRWAFPVYVIATGASVHVSRMAGPAYDDNLLLAPVVVTAALLSVLCAAGGRGFWGSIVLLAAGSVIHWVFVALFLAVLAGTALLLAPRSLRTWRQTGDALATPSARLAGIAGGAALAGGAGLLLLAGTEPSPPRLPRESFLTKLRADVPRYVFPVLVPVAAIGGASLALERGREDTRRPGLILLLVWTAAGAAAAAILLVGGSVPAHRFLAFALGVPILFAAGLVAAARLLVARSGRARAVAAALVLALGVGGGATIAYRAWYRSHPWMPSAQLAQAAEAGSYLRETQGRAPIVFLVDLGGHSPLSSTSLSFHVIRAGLPPEMISRTLVYLGEPEAFLAGRPTILTEPASYLEASLRHWPSVEAVLDRNPIVLMMPAFNRNFDAAVREHPEWLVSPNIAVVRGPPPRRPPATAPAPPAPLSPFGLAALTIGILLLLAVAGGGWAGALVPADGLARAATAPAFGVAFLAGASVLAGRAGMVPTTASSAVVVAGVTMAGWLLFAMGGIPGLRLRVSGRGERVGSPRGRRPAR